MIHANPLRKALINLPDIVRRSRAHNWGSSVGIRAQPLWYPMKDSNPQLWLRTPLPIQPESGMYLEHHTGFEPALSAWKADMLAIEHQWCLAPSTGIEPVSHGSKPRVVSVGPRGCRRGGPARRDRTRSPQATGEGGPDQPRRGPQTRTHERHNETNSDEGPDAP